MPFVRVLTNVATDNQRSLQIVAKLSLITAEILSKPESYVMASLATDDLMSFAGTTEPCAFIELKSLGLAETACPDISSALCDFLKSELQINPSRIYIEFAAPERSMFGWNSTTF
jgi:hypothetical protein